MKSSLSFFLPALLLFTACERADRLPEPGSDEYREAVTSFYTGLAAIQAGENQGAEAELQRVTELAPGEPAAWANLGLLSMRKNELNEAADRLQRAAELAPDNADIQVLLGMLESTRGHYDEAILHLQRAVDLDSLDVKAGYALAREIERASAPGADEAVLRLLGELLQRRPGNLALLLERARIAARAGDAATLRSTIAEIRAQADSWPQEAREQLDALAASAEAAPAEAATQVAFLRNVLLRVPTFRQDLLAIQTPPEEVGDLVVRFVRLPSPSPNPAPPDTALTFALDPLPAGGGPWPWAGALWLGTDETPALLVANGREARFLDGPTLAFPGGAAATPPTPHGIAGVDVNYDFRNDLALAGAGGLRLYRQDSTGAFTDVTAQMDLPASITGAAYSGVWPADVDMEGDIDLVLAPRQGPVRVLRNNGDGTFVERAFFGAVESPRDFAWGDLDADGDPDAAMIDAGGTLHVLTNQRSGLFAERAVPPADAPARALTIADVDSDGTFDLLVLRGDGSLQRLSDVYETDWQVADVGRWEDLPGTLDTPARLLAVDLDNNGALDLLASTPEGSRVWLGTEGRDFRPLASAANALVLSYADLTGNGRLDLIGVTDAGEPVSLINQGLASYHWKTMKLRAATTQGDQRINSFGIGGEVELRSGLLFQKQLITAPAVHFGIGEQTNVDVARIIWPNGNVQAEFDLASDQTVLANQRLKGSCPWLFTYDGEGMRFVTDFIWRSPLGLRINAQETAGIMATEDWVKIRGDQLVPRDGYYDLRITAELWETHFFDHVSLLVVDHPAGTEIFADERFAFPPPEHRVHPTAPLHPVAGARDAAGRDVTDVIRARDQRYLGGFPLSPYQGIAEPHYVEVDLGDAAPVDGPLYLVASGWVRPTDSSINVAISQGEHPVPTSLSLAVPDGQGGWATVRENLGFPSGKEKTMLLDLTGLFRPGTPHRVRLHTNLEIYWDAFAWAVPLPETELRTHHLQPDAADLRFRGFSAVTEADRTSPELPHYDRLNGTSPLWRDLEGYYTRFGDVRELLAEIDDRYVIMNAGDEMAFRFPAPPPPAEGWTRDFILIGDGWIKDGDYNTSFSKTVLPLPSHDQPDYDTPPTRLEDDPVYQRFPDDWKHYHTRYVAPRRGQLVISNEE